MENAGFQIRSLTLIAIILRTGLSMDIHGPKLLWKNILCLRVVTIRLAKSCFVRMWKVACYGCGGDGAIIVWVPGVSQAIVASNGTALGPPEARLPSPSLLPGRSQVTWPIIGTRTAGSSYARSILETIHDTVKGIATHGDA